MFKSIFKPNPTVFLLSSRIDDPVTTTDLVFWDRRWPAGKCDNIMITYTQQDINTHIKFSALFLIWCTRVNIFLFIFVCTFSFWYAVTAINSVSLKTYVRKVEYGNLIMSLALTRWKRGWYLCIEFNMVWKRRKNTIYYKLCYSRRRP